MNTIYIESNCKDKLALEVYFSKLLVWVICIFFLRPLPKYPEKQLSLSNIFFPFLCLILLYLNEIYAYMLFSFFVSLEIYSTQMILIMPICHRAIIRSTWCNSEKMCLEQFFSTNWDANVFVIMMINGNIIFPNKIRFSS